jgi:hypothetical protein
LAEEERQPGGPPGADDLTEAIRRLEVGQFLVSTATTLASLAYGKLEAGEPGQAKAAIDAVQALLPAMSGQVDAAIVRDLEAALANVKVAYADAVAKGG